ncbi:MAG: translation initiation factor IF-5A [Candidatus Nitrosocosmicus sp.]|jgi:translation initiation factor 5A|uniref:Translation initiation factor 5A n=1 Tax=Candidatus Nitrosocosmicus oleophilus TaxID=1353260 RepID=A0A654M170_9ARCH|nr:translation initiation factor IF-5A [Candidatus Nitrosocosmicus oleophilus]ALI36710.1 translation initiation factor IF-5A [Candidatus Nitrosocosmicus oleophilus]MDF0680127.1 translation initiation factor IF-5A [Candidatus Nitrosocosmicus sp.]
MDLGSLKVGSYIIIDGEPCRIVSYDHSKPGKHGSAKARVAAMGVFDGSRHSLVAPVSANVEVPLIDKRSGQLISVAGQVLQIMDLETFEVFETSAIEDEIRDKLNQGGEVEYWKVLERVKIVRVKG